MSQIHESINDACKEHLFDEKILLSPSLRVGHQWLDVLSMSGGTPVNVHVQTIRSIVFRSAEPSRNKAGAVIMNPLRGDYMTRELFQSLAASDHGYLFSLDPSGGVISSVYRLIQDLRLAGLSSSDLRPEHFESEVKCGEITKLLDGWNTLLKDYNLADYAQLLHWATDAVQQSESDSAMHTRLLIPEDLTLTWLEEKFVEAWPEDLKSTLPIDQSFDESRVAQTTDSDLTALRWLSTPESAPLPKNDHTVSIFQALGERNEVRAVLRKCLSEGTPLDTVELLYTDTQTYLPLIFETVHTVFADADGSTNEIPVTFDQGVPITYARPARALMSFVEWVKSDYPQPLIVQILQDTLLKFSAESGKSVSGPRMATLCREVFIGFQASRYDSVLELKLKELDLRIEETSLTGDEESREEKKLRLINKRESFVSLKNVLHELVSLGQEIEAGGVRGLNAVQTFLKEYTRGDNEFDNYARSSLKESAKALGDIMAAEESTEDSSILDWLQDLLRTSTIVGAGPRPGSLHVASILGGGHSGREHTFIVGLNDGRFPGAGLQDPLMLDHERREVSDRLPTASNIQKKKLVDFSQMIARLRGSVTVSYPCLDMVSGHEAYPSPALLSVYRIASGEHEGDFESFNDWVSAPVTFAPQREKECLTQDEWWLWRLCGSEPVANAQEIMDEAFPSLPQGRHAMLMRQSDEFTEYDGHVPDAAIDISPTADPGRPVSASALETLARCPFQFFMRYALGVKAPDDIAIDPDRWLQASDSGTLLHDVFRDYMRQLREEDLLPDHTRDEKRMAAVLDEHVNTWLDKCPPPTLSAYGRELHELKRAVHTFLVDETEQCDLLKVPIYFEAALGLSSDGSGTPLDSLEPIVLRLPSGQTMKARGRIDRIDRVGEEDAHAYEIWDYKTGGTSQFAQDDPFKQGRKIQNALYTLMVDKALKESVNPAAHLHRFGYFFPSAKGQGERISWLTHELSEGIGIIDKLCQLASNGAFIQSHNIKDCYFCDHATHSSDLLSAQELKLKNEENTALTPLRELRTS